MVAASQKAQCRAALLPLGVWQLLGSLGRLAAQTRQFQALLPQASVLRGTRVHKRGSSSQLAALQQRLPVQHKIQRLRSSP